MYNQILNYKYRSSMVARIVIGIGSAIVAAVGTYATKDYLIKKKKDEEKAKEKQKNC